MITIIAGSLRGKAITLPPESITRPVSQKVRAAIFNTLADRIAGAVVLDLYAGSGAMSLESISRGAQSAVCVDSNSKVITVIKQNIALLSVKDSVEAVKQSADKYLVSQIKERFDIIFADPPYTEINLGVLVRATELLNKDGILVVSCSDKTELPEMLGKAKILQTKIYGDTQIGYYKILAN